MVRSARVRYSSLRNSLINLPLSIHAQLVDRSISPQSLVVELSFSPPASSSSSSSETTSSSKRGPPQPLKAYVGWTGMPSAVADVGSHVRGQVQGETVEMDPNLAQMIGLAQLGEGALVSIELLRDLPTATAVNVTPVSSDDWEILETNAEFVETHLLSQVRAVKTGSTVGCWVNGTTLVRFLVDSTTPSTTSALLLTSDTELIVAPKTRNQIPSTASHTLTPTPTSSTPSQQAQKEEEWDSLTRKLVRLLPIELGSSLGIDVIGLTSGGEEETAAVYVPTSLFVRFKAVLQGSSLKCGLTHFGRPVTNRIDPPPGGGGGPTPGSGGGKEKDGLLSSGDRDGRGGGSVKDEAISSSSGNAGGVNGNRVEVRIREGKGLPSGSVWVSEKVRKELGVSIGSDAGFELLKFSTPLSPAAKKALQKALEKEASTSQSASRPSPSLITSPRALSEPISPSSSSSGSTPPVLAGVEDKLLAIRTHVVNSLASRSLGVGGGNGGAAAGILVTGASGAGKTVVVRQAGRELERDQGALTKTIYVDCSKHADERLPTLKSKMKDWFDEACWHAPSVLILDNLDRILGAEVEHADSFPALHLAHTFLALAQPALASRPIILLVTAQSQMTLHPLLSTTHLLGETVALRGPTKAGRRDILSTLVQAKTSSSNLLAENLNYVNVAGQTEGYLPADLRDLVDRAIHQAAIRTASSSPSSKPPLGLELTLEDFTAAQIGFVPLSLRDVKLQKSEVQWEDIGGLHETRRILRETLEWPTKYGAIFASCPIRLRSGLLLYGFPGCGKTLLASAVAKECGLNFISVKGPEILNKYIGASEKSVRDLFERAQAAKPCILFFDEFDSIAPKRGHDSTGVTDRVVNQMLTQMDGAEGLDGVYVLAATSRPDLIDPALLRPGRLDKSLLCDMPDFQDRLEIMQASARKIALSPSVDLSTYASQTAGFSGADLQALIYNAHLDAIHAGLAANEAAGGEEVTSIAQSKKFDQEDLKYASFGGGEGEGKTLSRAEQATVTKRLELIMNSLTSNGNAKKTVSAASARPVTHVEASHLEKSLQATRPSVPAAELIRLRRIYSEFVSGRSANGLPSGEPSDEVGGRSSLM